MAKPAAINIDYTRGDSAAIPFEVTDPDTSLAVDITGFTYILTVDPEPDPLTDVNNLFSVAGTVTDATNGKVEFRPTTTNSDQTPEVYFYDIQQTDSASRLQTVAKGKFTIQQDVTK